MFYFTKVVQVLIITSVISAASHCNQINDFLEKSWKGLIEGTTDRTKFYTDLRAFKKENGLEICNSLDYVPRFLDKKFYKIYRPLYNEPLYACEDIRDILQKMGPPLRLLQTVFNYIPGSEGKQYALNPKLQTWRSYHSESFAHVLYREGFVIAREMIGLDQAKCRLKYFWSNLKRLPQVKGWGNEEDLKFMEKAGNLGFTVSEICKEKRKFFAQLTNFLFSLGGGSQELKLTYIKIIDLYNQGNYKTMTKFKTFEDFLFRILTSKKIIKESGRTPEQLIADIQKAN
jgi:hypothetical protein